MDLEKIRFLANIKSQLLEMAVDFDLSEEAIKELLSITNQLDEEANSELLNLEVG